ncbi:RedY protein [Streptomyces gamaensis]|uniref:RedY protein n=1 Tax=Streptomyces gamaensis TaxID=1763542 RepID=A0ABW0YS34_9ACTN
MDIIVHRIRLRPGVSPERFETWVRETDYTTCPQLPSVRSFSVQKVSADPRAPFHYFEVITVVSQADFAADMKSDVFRGLVSEFEEMASVIDEAAGERIAPGYHATA